MTRRNVVAVLTLTPLVSAQSGESNIRNKFVGVWKLVSFETKDNASDEVRNPYGAKPVGRITYDEVGRMSAQVMNPTRQWVGGFETRGLTAAAQESSCEQVRAILAGYIAYFGRFEVDELSFTVTHHIEGSLVPGPRRNWTPRQMRRLQGKAPASGPKAGARLGCATPRPTVLHLP
jgi:lipocalin-like protein